MLVTGSPGELDLAEYVARTADLPPHATVAGQTTPLNLARLVAEAAVVVSGDTGVAHLANFSRRTARCNVSSEFDPPRPGTRRGAEPRVETERRNDDGDARKSRKGAL